jgi:MoaA/NifB/PqqE/SkfB family radical SAM enzyme
MNFNEYNTGQETSFTSTGDKLLFHRDAVDDLRNHKNHPIVLHIMPTEVCNLRCVFCSVAQRGEDGRLCPNLTMDQIHSVVAEFKKRGLKAVIISGGGEPLMYTKINELVDYLYNEGLQIGLITNGILLSTHLKPENLDKLTWVRVSINSMDYVGRITMPKLNSELTTLGFSYIWNNLTNDAVLQRIKSFIADVDKINKVQYVRLLPDCNLETSALEAEHKKLRQKAEELGAPFFHQYKIHEQPPECHLGRVHPVLYTDGYIYPCDSLVLNSPMDDKKFHREYALCGWDEVADYYDKPICGSLVDTRKCPHCVFARQNKLITKIVHDDGPVPEAKGEITHINFI